MPDDTPGGAESRPTPLEMAVVPPEIPEQSLPDLFDPIATYRYLSIILPKLGNVLDRKIEINAGMLWDAAQKTAHTLAELSSDQEDLRKAVIHAEDPAFPGKVAWSKQVSTLTYYLLRLRPIIKAWYITHRGPLNEDGAPMITISRDGDTSANEHVCLLLLYTLLADGVSTGRVWRLTEQPKPCLSNCDAYDCFLDRYWQSFYGDGSEAGQPSNLAFMLNILKCEGLSRGAISIIADHILYGACILAPTCQIIPRLPPPESAHS